MHRNSRDWIARAASLETSEITEIRKMLQVVEKDGKAGNGLSKLRALLISI
jgi:hypothetical protein